jgi:hypothetical protein
LSISHFSFYHLNACVEPKLDIEFVFMNWSIKFVNFSGAIASAARSLALLLTVTVLMSIAPRVSAITDGRLDNNDHPYVGLVVVFSDAEGTIPLWRGSGTLISPRIFVTAGHVAGPDSFTGEVPKSARVYFESNVDALPGYPLSGGHTGTPVPHPDYPGFLAIPNSHDIGVVVLDEPAPMAEYGLLPSLGVLDALATKRGKQNVTFDVVGYGVQYIRQNPIKGPIFLQADRIRYQGTVSIINLKNALTDGYNIQHSGDNGKGNGSGATNFGDSGGPVLLAGTRVLVATTSFGFNDQGTGPGFAFRTDTAGSQSFLKAVFETYDPNNNPFDP